MYKYLGIMFVGIGLAHCAVGLVGLAPAVQDIISVGVVGAADVGHPSRMAVLWFEATGVAIIAIGLLVDWAIRQQRLVLPLPFVITFLIMAVLITVLSFGPGAWLFLAATAALAVGTVRRRFNKG